MQINLVKRSEYLGRAREKEREGILNHITYAPRRPGELL